MANNTNPVFRKIESEVQSAYVEGSEVRNATFNGFLLKTGILFVAALVAGAVFFQLFSLQAMYTTIDGYLELNSANAMPFIVLAVIAPILAFVSAIVGTLSVKASPVCAILYSLFEGIFFGMVIGFLELVMPGIGVAAIVSLAAIFGVTLLMYSFKVIRVTKKFYRVVSTMLIAAIVMIGLNFILSLFFSPMQALMSTGIGGMWMVILIEVFFVVLGSLMLCLDFDRATQLAENGFPKKYEWQASLGLMVTLVWILIHLLRILVIIFGRRR